MDYKSIIKNRELRLRILQFFSFVPDKTMIKLQYRIKMGRRLNLKSPARFTEKLQWYKLYYKNPLMISCVDKYDVRGYVADKGLGKILNPCYGVYDSEEQIKWEELPNQFVIKDTLGGGGTSVIIVKAKEQIDKNVIKNKCKDWIMTDVTKKSGGREWPYYSGKRHRIIIEKYIDSNIDEGGLLDYKFFCFNGKAEYLYVIADRRIGDKAGFGIYNSEFELLPVTRNDEEPLKRTINKPENYEQLKSVAEALAGDFPEVRVDLYNVDGQIIFGEMTFFDGSGYMTFEPDSFDYELGSKFVIGKGVL